MHPHRFAFAAINLVGGFAVLGSYAWGLVTHPETAPDLWGDLPDWAVVPYTASMPFAAVGYLAMAWFLWRHLDPDHPSQRGFLAAFAVALACSAAWMPMSFAALASGDPSWLP